MFVFLNPGLLFGFKMRCVFSKQLQGFSGSDEGGSDMRILSLEDEKCPDFIFFINMH